MGHNAMLAAHTRTCMRCTSTPASAPAPCLVGGAMQWRTTSHISFQPGLAVGNCAPLCAKNWYAVLSPTSTSAPIITATTDGCVSRYLRSSSRMRLHRGFSVRVS